jgi:hypothetical protein
MNVVSIYIIDDSVAKRIELFNDEKISVTSSIASANDVGKVFTDYSQSFTVPASDHNNSIFRHWYESEVDNGFLHGQRYNGYIEINTILFKEGKFQLEKANKKNGRIESYTITFYGNLTQLKDLFKDDKLNTLDYTDLNHPYTSAEIKTRVSTLITVLYDVMYPLIGTEKKFYYKTGGTTNDVTLSANAIKWNSLFPAIRLTSIISFIEEKYGITFTGSFLTLKQWTKLRLYCKNAESLSVPTEQLKINFTSKSSSPAFPEMNLADDTITINPNIFPSGPVGNNNYTYSNRSVGIRLLISPQGATSLLTKYRIFVYRNGSLFYTYNDLIGNSDQYITVGSLIGNTNQYYFKVDSENPFTFTTQVIYARSATYKITGSGNPNPINISSDSFANGTSQTTIGSIQIGNYIPDISVVDFFTGLVKMFNLIIVPTTPTSFELIPLELYYQQGNINDVTEYIRSEEADIERPKLFKSINFKYEKSANILNNAFYRTFNLEYGDLVLDNVNMNETSNYEIKLPFENVLFERSQTAGTLYPFETATIIDKDLKPYTPKPVFIYENGKESVAGTGNNIWITTTSTSEPISSYQRFSNEVTTVPTDLNYLMSSNFGEYQSPWYGTNASNGLYARHYENYIANIYNPKTRIVKVKAVLPEKLLGSTTTDGFGRKLGLKLNDRLIIRDKRYIINSFTTDLTTGETDLELLNDYRTADAATTVGYRFSSSDVIRVDNTEKEVEYLIYKNEYDSFNILPQDPAGFVKYVDVSDCVEDTALTAIIDPNTSGVERTGSIGLEYFQNGVSVLTTFLIVRQDV